MKNKRILKSDQETKDFAKELAKKLLDDKNPDQPVVIALTGDLGAGKTTFTQGFAKALGVKKRILSPTFLIMKRFTLPKDVGFKNLYHIDAYRISKEDLEELEFKKALLNPNIIVIEWADRVKAVLPKGTIWLRFKHGSTENERQITINRR